MDDFKQLHPLEYSVSEKFTSLFNVLTQHGKTVTDVLLFDSSNNLIQLAKIIGRSIREIEAYVSALKGELQPQACELSSLLEEPCKKFISTGLSSLDQQMGGGIPLGEITEVFGASGCGKSQFLLQLASNCQSPEGECIYISTESFLETKRLKNFLNDDASMGNVSYIFCPDLESQDHILYTQLPIKLQKSPKVRLVVIDSMAQHLRREDGISNSTYLKEIVSTQQEQLQSSEDYQQVRYQKFKIPKTSQKFQNKSSKSHYLSLIYRHLSRLASTHNIAIVLVNQVSDFVTSKEAHAAGDVSLNNASFRSEEVSEMNSSFQVNACTRPNEPLNLDFQSGISAGWDIVTLRNSFDSAHANPEDDLELLEWKLQNWHQVSKKRKIDELALENENETSAELELQKLYSSLNKINRQTKRQVPTFGYTWSKRIQNRILLMKFYKPILSDSSEIEPESGLTRTQLFDGFNLPQNQEPEEQNSILGGWKIERYGRVVSSNLHNSAGPNNKFKFTITSDGLIEE